MMYFASVPGVTGVPSAVRRVIASLEIIIVWLWVGVDGSRNAGAAHHQDVTEDGTRSAATPGKGAQDRAE